MSSTNTIACVTIFGTVFIGAGFVGLLESVSRSPWVTDAYAAREQPIQFSHERHVAGNGIDCRYCHTSVEESSFAGIPPTKTCMNCHSQIFSGSPFLEPVRDSFRTGKAIQWTSAGRSKTVKPVKRGRRMTGSITRLWYGQGHGFIRADDRREMFFHYRDVAAGLFNALAVNDRVLFEVIEDAIAGPRAVNVRRAMRLRGPRR